MAFESLDAACDLSHHLIARLSGARSTWLISISRVRAGEFLNPAVQGLVPRFPEHIARLAPG
jgi:hypothetical protein